VALSCNLLLFMEFLHDFVRQYAHALGENVIEII